jgi:hypothetical protein
MKRNLLAPFLPLIVLWSAGFAVAEGSSVTPGSKDAEKIAQIQQLLTATLIDTRDLPQQMSLVQSLTALEAKLPAGKKISFQIDEGAFGKQLPQVAGATVKIRGQNNVSPAAVLRLAVSQVSKVEEVDYGIRPDGVVITRPRLAADSRTYDVTCVVNEIPRQLPYVKNYLADVFQNLDPTDDAGLLVRLVLNEVDLRPWETIDVLNGVKLVVLASPTRHEEIADLLQALRRLADLAVVMNARLYEVDRAFFAKHVAPLFPADAPPEERPRVVAIDKSLLEKVTRQKLLLESEDIKIRPNQQARFLSRQSAFRFAAGPRPDKEDRTLTGTGLAGVSFEVLPLVSADRRYLRLQISQKVVQLAGIEKARTLDVATGKDVEVESPNLRRTSVTGAVQIPDGNPILMPVEYRPPDKGSEDKVWLLMARPFIWIEEEVRERKKQGQEISAKSIWNSEVQKEEGPATANPLPFNDQVREILQAIVTSVLTDPDLKSTREFYGTARDKTFALVDEGNLGWPKEFRPETHGYKLVQVQHDPFVSQRRVLGIRIDKFDLIQKKVDPMDAPIEVCLFNAGGNANGGVIGGCSVYYVPKRVGKHWTAECTGWFDP